MQSIADVEERSDTKGYAIIIGYSSDGWVILRSLSEGTLFFFCKG